MRSAADPVARGERAFTRLLALFPRGFRARFGDDMRDLFRDQLRAAHAGGGARGIAGLWRRTLPSLLRSAVLARRDERRERRLTPGTAPANPSSGGDGMLATLVADLRFAWRTLRKTPVFTLVAVLVIALGCGAVTTIFSAMNALLLRPLAGTSEPARLVRIEPTQRGDDGVLSISYPSYEYLRDRTRTLDGVVAWSKAPLTIATGVGATTVHGSVVSGDYFAVLGVRPALGRFFLPEEARTELTHPVIVVSEGFWRTRLGADSAAVGRTLTVNGHLYTLIGVAAAAFTGTDVPIRTDAWVPLQMVRQLRPRTSFAEPHGSWLRLAGRLREGSDADAVRREMAVLSAARRTEAPALARAKPWDDFRVPPLTGLPSDATRALERGNRIDPGFDANGVVVAAFDAESWGYDEARARAFYAALREQVAALPGVTAVTYAEKLPLVFNSSGDDIQVDGAPPGPDGRTGTPVRFDLVDAEYFDVIRMPLAEGRTIARTDDGRAPRVAVVNETLARRHWPDGSALGRTFTYGGARVTIVGVARDAKYASLAERTPEMVYFPLEQQWRPRRALLVRAAVDAAQLAPAIERAVRALDPALPRPVVSTLRYENRIVLLPQRVAAGVTAALGGLGMLLASVGLYGVIAYSVGRRTREIAIRVAVGASRTDVLALIVREGMRLATLGVAIGLLLSGAATRLLGGLLFDVSPLDAATFGSMSLLLLAVALGASWLPARKAAALPPRAALGAE